MKVVLGRDSYEQHSQIFDWCRKMFGSFYDKDTDTDKWTRSITFGIQTYTFQDENDGLLFILRWGGHITEKNQ